MTNLPHDNRPCLRNYSLLGYCPKESEKNSASLTLAYAYDDWLVRYLTVTLGVVLLVSLNFSSLYNMRI